MTSDTVLVNKSINVSTFPILRICDYLLCLGHFFLSNTTIMPPTYHGSFMLS